MPRSQLIIIVLTNIVSQKSINLVCRKNHGCFPMSQYINADARFVHHTLQDKHHLIITLLKVTVQVTGCYKMPRDPPDGRHLVTKNVKHIEGRMKTEVEEHHNPNCRYKDNG